LYVYAFVAIHNDHLDSMRRNLCAVKRAIRPDSDPEKWKWHTLEVRKSKWRVRHGVKLSIREIDQQLQKLAIALSAEGVGRFISATIFPPFDVRNMKRKVAEATVRDRALTASIIGITEFLTRQGFAPQFTIESQTLSRRKNEIDYFVERIGRGLRHDLGFLYICRCKMVGLPITAPKGASIEMELADFVAFMVRRYFFLGMSEQKCEVPPSLFGSILWTVFRPRGFETHMATGFPLSHFYPHLA
jgi:hypothetical protein